MPVAMSFIALFIPQAWVLKGWKITLDGGSAADLLLPFAVMVGMGIVMFFIGASMFRKRFA
jgi:hypothetical protein